MIKKQKSTETCHICCHLAVNKLKLSWAAEIGGKRLEKETNIYRQWSKKRPSLLVRHCHHSSQFRAKVKFKQLPMFTQRAINNAKRWREPILSWLTVYYTKISHAFYKLTPRVGVFFFGIYSCISGKDMKSHSNSFITSDNRINIFISVISFNLFKDKHTSRKRGVTLPRLSCWQLWTPCGLQEVLTNAQFLFC